MSKERVFATAFFAALLFAIFAAPHICIAASNTDIDALLASPELRGGTTAIVLWDLDSGASLYEKNIDALLTPASNMKLVTAAAAIFKLGTEFQFRTDFFVSGWNPSTGVAKDLYIRGLGDPSFSDEFFESNSAAADAIADSIARHGLRRVTGNIIIDDSAFSGPEYPRGWDGEDSGYCYGMKAGALSIAENCLILKVTGAAKAGQRPVITADPPLDTKMTVVTATTSAKGGKIRVSIDAAGIARISGSIAPGRTAEIEYPAPHPAMFFGNVLAGALRRKGIEVDGKLIKSGKKSTDNLQPLVSLASPYISEILSVMLKKSDNFIAETLLRTLALDRGGTINAGAETVRSLMRQRKLAATENLIVYDGSGLSRQNKLTPRVLMSLLGAFYNSNLKTSLSGMMAEPGQKGTLKKRFIGTSAEGRVWAKTGALRGACSLSGYLKRSNGNTAAFSMIMNGYSVHSSAIRNIQDKLLLIMLDL